MKIESRIRPRDRDTRNVTVLGEHIAFKKQKDGSFVADVTREDVLGILLSGNDFRAVGSSAPALKRAPAPPVQPPQPPAPEDSIHSEAAALLEFSVADMGVQVGNVSSIAVVRVALELEQAENGKQRKGVVTLLETALAAAAQAGVQG